MLTTLRVAIDVMFRKNRKITNILLRAGFMTTSDAIIQLTLQKNQGKDFDFHRTQRAIVLGATLGYVGHRWYTFLDDRYPGRIWPSLRKKLIAEMIATPAFAVLIFGISGMLKGDRPQKIWGDLIVHLPTIYVVDWLLYVPAQAVNFRYVDPRFRVLFVCCFALMYDLFLAYILNCNEHDGQEGKKVAAQKSH